MNKRIFTILGVVVVLLGVLAVGWYLASPLFINDVVDEDFPIVEAAAVTPTEEIEAPIETASVADQEDSKEVVVETEVGETEVVEVVATSDAMEETEPVEEMEEEMEEAGGITAVLSGNFTDADAAHKGSGIATIYQQGEDLILRFEEFSVTNGPALHVYLSTSANPTDDLGEYIDLGDLKGNIGDQNYTIPAGTDLSQYQSIIIYCEPFSVVFSTAMLNS